MSREVEYFALLGGYKCIPVSPYYYFFIFSSNVGVLCFRWNNNQCCEQWYILQPFTNLFAIWCVSAAIFCKHFFFSTMFPEVHPNLVGMSKCNLVLAGKRHDWLCLQNLSVSIELGLSSRSPWNISCRTVNFDLKPTYNWFLFDVLRKQNQGFSREEQQTK